jgi:hypothetical protein
MKGRAQLMKAVVIVMLAAWRLSHPTVADAAGVRDACGRMVCGAVNCEDAEWQCAECPGWSCLATATTVMCFGGEFDSSVYCWANQ